MATNNDVAEVIDSQLLAENVGFLENCFDNSFALTTSLLVVKEYAAEEGNKLASLKESSSQNRSKINLTQNKTIALDASVCNVTKTGLAKAVNKNLKAWGLPLEIAKKYEQRGIIDMFDWQVTCLSNPKVLLDCCNLVYSAPTSAGKTLVAEILTIKTILERQKKVIVILPFVSIVREKMFYLQDILSTSGIRVEGFMGSQSPPGGLQAVHVAICTIEKANSLVNRLLDDGSISDLGAVIVDELHLLGDPHRGYILELLLTKIKYVSSKIDDCQVQIVGMSATLPNLEILANWLDAELFVTDFRPIPLDEYCLVGNKYFDKHGKLVSTIQKDKTAAETDFVLKICLDTIKEGCSVLIFCMTKSRCENLAQSISSSFYKLGCSGSDVGLTLRSQLKSESIFEVLAQLKNCPVGLDQILKTTISFGVAYHHAGLTFDERDIIEGGFKSGAIRVLVATSTLSSGVNLPARKVIVRSPVFQRQPINILTYKQMIGRAGRMGKDLKGESILVCTETEKKIGFGLMMGALDPVKSCIESEDKYMRAVLEMIASQVVCTKEELDLYSKCTLLSQQSETVSQNLLLGNTLDELINYELVRIQDDGSEKRYVATPLGKACLSSSMAPNDGLSLFCELQKARQCLVLETDLHLIYLVTPYSVSSQWGDIDWLHLLTLWESLTKAMKRVGELIGVQESFIIRCLRGANKLTNVQNKLNIHKRFYTALALQDLVNEVPLSEVANKFQCARGFLQSLQQAAATFAGMVTAFSRQLGWKNMEMLISQFQDRLHFGIHSELLELMKLPTLNGIRARTLFDAGFETISSIASADVNIMENALHKTVPFQSDKEREGDDSNDLKKRNKIKSIWITGSCGITTRQAAENLISEARKYLVNEIGVAEIKWEMPAPNQVDAAQSNLKNISNLDVKEEPDTTNKLVQENYLDNVISLDKPKIKAESVIVKIENEEQTSGDTNYETCLTNKVHCQNQDINESPSIRFSSPLVGNPNVSLNKIIEDEIKNSPNILPRNVTVGDEIIWDSLNFTDVGIENVTKIKPASSFDSPNMSFGETEVKREESLNSRFTSSNSKSVNDVSLFSSDGDNSSLFEESLPLDLISSKLLNGEYSKTKTVLKEFNNSNYNVTNLQCDTILNAFKSTLIEVEEDEDIKLVYEDENKVSENELEVAFNTSEEVMNTQLVKETTIKDMFISPLKRLAENNILLQPSNKKLKVDNKSEKTLKNDKLDKNFITLNNPKSKLFSIQINEFKYDCYVLKENDICTNLDILMNVKEASIYLDIKSVEITSNEVIGSNILGKGKNSPQVKNAVNGKKHPIKGMAIYIEEKICVLLDLMSLDANLIHYKLSRWLQMKQLKIKVMNFKSMSLQLKIAFGSNISTHCVDISLAEWLLDSDEKIPSIVYLTKKYCNIDLSTVFIRVNEKSKKLSHLDSFEDACVKAWCVWTVAERQHKSLLEQYVAARDTLETETQTAKILSDCEFHGICVDKELASRLLIDVRNSQETLQKKAYKICGYHFNFNSSKDVAKVLGIYKGRKVSTKKSVLTSHNSPMSSIVIFWRKLNSILTKTLYPLTEKACIYSPGDRINPSYTIYTCTGRVSMHEPNLQNVPRTFSIPLRYLSEDKVHSSDIVEFNCRNIFKAASRHVLVSADYCQLEMRILTHYSEDPVLMRIMSSGEDVFKSIAASWSNVPEDEVDEDLRQKAKQLCYGILYGMGNRTLSQHLDVTELEAAMFMDSFYKTYPAIRTFTQTLIQDCRRRGYVETLTKRRRFLGDINSNVMAKKSAAERQAVNTTIQGSAADIAKAAMCAIDNRTSIDKHKPRLILQMHDELIYEVPESSKQSFIKIIKQVMEDTVKLKVPLPVKVKCGVTWGTLKDVTF